MLKLIPGIGTAAGGAISGTTASVLTTALGEAYIAIMKMIANGEIKSADLGDKHVQEKMQAVLMQAVFKDRISHK